MMDQMMGGMMMSPFGQPGGGPFGGGGMFGMMDQMTADMRSGGGMMGMQNGGGGTFSCQTMSMSSSVGPDGQVRSERFTSSTVGDREHGCHETQQAYANDYTGEDKMSMERQLRDQGRKVVKERSRHSGEERQTNLFRGMSEEHAEEFNARWEREAAPHLPRHHALPQHALDAGGAGYNGSRAGANGASAPPARRAALPAYGAPRGPAPPYPSSAPPAQAPQPYPTQRGSGYRPTGATSASQAYRPLRFR